MGTNQTSAWLTRIALLTLFSISFAAATSAQPSGEGQQPIRTTAESIATELSTDNSAQTTVRESDSLWNGALIGAATGVAAGLFLCTQTEPWENCRDDVGPMLRIGAIGAGVGIAIDALIRKRTTSGGATAEPTRLHATSIISRHARELRVSVRF